MRFLTRLFLITVALIISGCAAPSPTADVAHGQVLYTTGKGEAPPCATCHALQADIYSIGPHMVGVASRVEAELNNGQTVKDYLRESILNPNAHLVPGYRSIMYGLYADHLTEQDIDDLIGYILSL